MTWLPVVSLATNLLVALLLYSLRSSIRIAILELKEELTKTYATRDDLRKVEEKVDLSQQLREGVDHLGNLIQLGRRRNNRRQQETFVPR